ncbi:hypothetical protein RFI_24468 [Reticulomyxa filosa]|uniref:acetyl-CoA C-acetyltransferase n=1 Tax=Reticulomyxa filosa TaxID=46433 RepID=X6MHM6_RETFI|nr:hypothetical protein RFI_24468 [Reticulomyxa filosa]|eukprot:ETO12907.1 hypothetical protein RFI_24468 [Reticulomyxa filosa]
MGCFDRCVGVPKDSVDECIFGNVLSANVGQNPARQVSRAIGLKDSVPCTTVNKVCASGLKAVSYGAQSIELGNAHVALSFVKMRRGGGRRKNRWNFLSKICSFSSFIAHIFKYKKAGGMESMSNAPYYSLKTRFGARMGNIKLIDGMIRDGLSDALDGTEMGTYADKLCIEHSITRSKLDDFAIESYQRAQMAYQRNMFDGELVSIEVPSAKRGQPPTLVDKDEGCWKLNEEKIRHLKPAFGKDGMLIFLSTIKQKGFVTAGNASQLSDGGAALILASEEAVKDYNLKPLAKILGYADAEQASELFGTTPSLAIPKALQKAGLDLRSLTEMDFFEINEAFACVTLANQQLLKINPYNINMYGGAIALGHPIGCSGARILVTLITVLKENAGRYGIAAVCNGGGGATAMVIENMS